MPNRPPCLVFVLDFLLDFLGAPEDAIVKDYIEGLEKENRLMRTFLQVPDDAGIEYIKALVVSGLTLPEYKIDDQ